MTSAGRRGHVVLLAYHYPPMLGAASERAASFARYLPACGWEPVVVTVKGGFYHRDPAHAGPAVATLRTRSPELSGLRGARGRAGEDGDRVVTVRPTRLVGSEVKRVVRDYLYVPDAQAPWIPFAVAGAERALAGATGPAVLLSTSVPYSAHLAAGWVARRTGVPWIAEFRDPWAHVHQAIRPRGRARVALDRALECRVVAAADAVVVTSERTRDTLERNHALPHERLWVVRNGYEPIDEAAGLPPAPTEPLELVHTGTVPAHVPLAPILQGIQAVAGRAPSQVRLRVLGPPDRWREAASALDDPSWLAIGGLVSPAAARRACASAAVNVLICPGVEYDEHVASKLMEYFGVRRPILATVSASGEMAALGREYGEMRVVSRYDGDEIGAAVEALLSDHRAGRLQDATTARKPIDHLTREHQAGRLALALDAASGRS